MEDRSPSLRCVRCPKVEILVEMRCVNLQSPVWSRHVGVPLRCTSKRAGAYFGYLGYWLSWLSALSKQAFTKAFFQIILKSRDINTYFGKRRGFIALHLCHAPPQLWNIKCAGFQTKDAIELEHCTETEINLVSLMPGEEKRFWWRHVKTSSIM